MTEEQRRQVAAQRCADLANEFSSAAWEPEDFTGGVGVQAPLFNTILELDELARHIADYMPMSTTSHHEAHALARKHILPDPVPTPVERFCHDGGWAQDIIETALDRLGLELVEKSND